MFLLVSAPHFWLHIGLIWRFSVCFNHAHHSRETISAYCEGKVGTLPTLTATFFFSCCSVQCVSFLDEISVRTVVGTCFLIPVTALNLCIDSMFSNPFTSVTEMRDCALIIWKRVFLYCRSVLWLELNISSTLLASPVNGSLFANIHWLGTNSGMSRALKTCFRLYCVPCHFNCHLVFACSSLS